MAAEEVDTPSWRGWHVIGRFLPMLFLGMAFFIFGLSPEAPHHGAVKSGILFVLVGVVLWIGALIGMIFTKCPICYQTNWVFCVQERDVVRVHDHGSGDAYVRDLALPEDDR